jgi:hypothetical protein
LLVLKTGSQFIEYLQRAMSLLYRGGRQSAILN